MNYTRQEVEQFVEEEDVKFIRLTFCDIYGNVKNKSIMSSQLKRAFDYGIPMDAWAVAGFDISDARSDLLLHPDPATLSILPWRPDHGRVVRMYCDITWTDGRVFEADTRYVLKKAVEEAEAKGFYFTFAAEQEFYLFEKDENGEPTKKPYDNGSYMDVAPVDRCENIRREICMTLEKMGISPESSHHEEGPGQNEIDYRYASPLQAADNVMSFEAVVRTIAGLNGVHADFSPKPLENEAGSGMHINFAVEDLEGNDRLDSAVAGILSKISEMTVFLNPEESSYKRLGSGKAPGYVSWAHENRSQLIRIPDAAGGYRRAELRSPDSCANPYIAFALIIKACLLGLENGMELPDENEMNLFKMEREELKKLQELPGRLNEARYNAASSEFIKESLPLSVVAAYVK